MGMGEPLDNYNAVHESTRGLTHQCLFGLNAKQITISTVGASISKLQLLADEIPQISLALSLHSALSSTRQLLIPSSSSLEDLGNALDYYSQQRQQKVTTAHFRTGFAKPLGALKVLGLQIIFPIDQADQTRIKNDAGVGGLEEFFCMTGTLESC